MEKRVQKIIEATEKMVRGAYHIHLDLRGNDDLAVLAKKLNQLGAVLEKKFREIETLSKVTEKINSGMLLEDVLNYTFESFRPIIPYNRIGLALLEDEGHLVRAHWARTDQEKIVLTKGYSASMEGSSLQKIIQTGRPRIINDLEAYILEHPTSESTQKILAEGIRSSLTCPLIAMGKPIGFIFFSSREKNTYRNIHVDLFVQIAGQFSMIIEKSRLYQQLLDLNELKNKFLGIAAHDLRSPISAINGWLDLIINGHLGELNEKQRDSLKGIRQWCEQMLRLTEDLLDVSAIESGQIHLNVKEVPLRPYLRESVAFNQNLANAKQIRLDLDISDCPETGLFDPDRVHQILNNLISNAIKYSPEKATVLIRAEAEDAFVRISIQDHGEGILADELERVFGYFQKGSAKPTGGESSTGLGLAICKRLVEAHGGRIWVASEEGEGSIFYFTLPQKKEDRG